MRQVPCGPWHGHPCGCGGGGAADDAMARLIAIDGHDLDPKLRSFLGSSLRMCDEAIVLPPASRSSDSGAVKGVVMRLHGSATEPLSPEIFSANWFCGVSMIRVPNEKAELLLASDAKRTQMLKKLVAAIPSEMQDSDVQVGPDLDGDEFDRDTKTWSYGFDGPGCCVGLYSALQSRAPEAHRPGMERQFREYYIVAKAGAGIAAQTFHARLTAALRAGQSLEDIFGAEGSDMGLSALRRVASAARRNRERILLAAAEALGIYNVDTVGDSCGPSLKPHRLAIPTIEACYNSLHKVGDAGGRCLYQYAAGCVDAAVSTGCVTSSNLADGFIAFVNHLGEAKINLRNEAHSCIPFSTPRLLSNREALFAAMDAHKAARKSPGGKPAHPDAAWVRLHFGWSAKVFDASVDLEPAPVWGSHARTDFLAEWARELGLSRAGQVQLQPELVAISAVEPGKLRVAVKDVAKVGPS